MWQVLDLIVNVKFSFEGNLILYNVRIQGPNYKLNIISRFVLLYF